MNRAAGPEPIGQYIWLMDGGGLELYQELVAPKLPNLMYPRGAGFIGTPEVFCHSTIKFETPEDLVGVNMRTAGDGGEVLARMGVNTLMMPHEEIYESIQRGLLDMGESGGPQFNWDLAYQEVAPYMYLGTLRQPCEWLGYAINRQSWEALTPELQGIVHLAVRADAMVYYNETIMKDAATVQKFRDYGNEVLAVPDPVKVEFREKAAEFYAEASADDPFMQKALKSMDDFMAVYYGYVGTWD
jgi:TRAP-type mannitol/chloroaromatic compound transport system substrate-binding protein